MRPGLLRGCLLAFAASAMFALGSSDAVGAAIELLPQATVRASDHFEYGLRVGMTFAPRIQESLATYPLLPPMRALVATDDGAEMLRTLYAAASECYPEYVAEMRGMAQGSAVDLDDLLLLNLRSELEPFLPPEDRTARAGDFVGEGCSDILLQRHNDTLLLGHNEDGSGAFRNTSFLVHAHIGDELPFTAHYYAGFIGGNTFGFNEARMVLTTNALSPVPALINTTALGRQFVNRALLQAGSVGDVVQVLQKCPRASGFSLNAADAKTGRMVNVEVGPTAFDLLALDRAPLHTYFHANKYLRLDISQDPSPSSDHRMKRYEQYPTPQDAGDVATILSDNEDRAYPIFRRPRPTDDEWTLATAMFDLLHGELQIYVQKPANAPSVVRLDF